VSSVECAHCRFLRLNYERQKEINNENQEEHPAGLSKLDLKDPSSCQTKHRLQPMLQPMHPQAEKPIETPLLVRDQPSEYNTFFCIFGFITSVITLALEVSGFVPILCALALLMAIVIVTACATQATMPDATPSARSLAF